MVGHLIGGNVEHSTHLHPTARSQVVVLGTQLRLLVWGKSRLRLVQGKSLLLLVQAKRTCGQVMDTLCEHSMIFSSARILLSRLASRRMKRT